MTWDEVAEHIVRRLAIDDQWRIDDPERQAFTWWPWVFSQTIQVTATGDFEDESGDNWMRITATTNIAEAEETTGMALVHEWADRFPFGALMHDDGILTLTTSLAINPLCRQLLSWFHEAVLAQATFAAERAQEWHDLPGVRVLVSEHPVTGLREEPDELLHIFYGPEFSLDPMPELYRQLEVARPIYTHRFLTDGYERGFENDEVVYFNGPTFDFAIGTIPDSEEALKYGQGLRVVVRVLPPGDAFSDAEVNDVNRMIRYEFDGPFAQPGPITGGEAAVQFGSELHTYLPHGVLAEYRHDPVSLATLVVNFTRQCIALVSTFQRAVLTPQDTE